MKISQESIDRVLGVTQVDIALALGLPTRIVGKQMYIPCPNPEHQETQYDHCCIEMHKNIFHCFTCGHVGGNGPLAFYSWFKFGKKEGTFKQSVFGVAELFDIELRDERGNIMKPGSNNYTPTVKVVTQSLDPQPMEIIDVFYRAFLSLCPLRHEHYKELTEKRRYTDDEINLYMFRSVPTLDEWIRIYSILKSNNYPFERIPGLSQIFQPNTYQTKFPLELGEIGEFTDHRGQKHAGRWFYVLSAAQANGYFIPVFNENGYITRLRIRKDNGDPKYVWFSSTHNVEVEDTIQKARRNGVSSGAPITIEIPPDNLKNWQKGVNVTSVVSMQTLGVIEGEHKAKIGAKCFNIPFAGLPGAGNFRDLLPLIKKWGVKKLIICYDMDTLQREDNSEKSINKQKTLFEIVKNFAREVSKLGVESVIWTWNMNDGKGLDDLVHNYKLPVEYNLRTGVQRGVSFSNVDAL